MSTYDCGKGKSYRKHLLIEFRIYLRVRTVKQQNADRTVRKNADYSPRKDLLALLLGKFAGL